MLPVTTLMGYAFPLTARLFISAPQYAGRGVGAVYGCNTAGAVLGTVLTGFALIPWLGTNHSIVVVGFVQAAAACVFLLLAGSRRKPKQVLVLSTLLAAILGASFLPVVSQTSTQLRLSSEGVLVSHTEDTIATVDASGGPRKNRQLYVGGNGVTALTIDTKLVAYLPKALRPGASNILLIAFGMGTSYRSALTLKLITDVVELSPDVPSAMPAFYEDAASYLNNPLGHIIIDDGRNYVRFSNRTYDLIALDAPPPTQAAGTAVLLTQEFYQEVKQRLVPGGVFGTFLPVDMSICDLKSHLRTFRQTFAHAMVVRSPGQNGIFVIGSDAPLVFDSDAVKAIFGSAAAQKDLGDAPDFRSLSGSQWVGEINHDVWLQDGQIDAFTGNVPLITDDHPYSEYFLLRSLFGSHC
jgi:predicted membrane-bound spermidine synthase